MDNYQYDGKPAATTSSQQPEPRMVRGRHTSFQLPAGN